MNNRYNDNFNTEEILKAYEKLKLLYIELKRNYNNLGMDYEHLNNYTCQCEEEIKQLNEKNDFLENELNNIYQDFNKKMDDLKNTIKRLANHKNKLSSEIYFIYQNYSDTVDQYNDLISKYKQKGKEQRKKVLNDDQIAEIKRLRQENYTIKDIYKELGIKYKVSQSTIYKALQDNYNTKNNESNTTYTPVRLKKKPFPKLSKELENNVIVFDTNYYVYKSHKHEYYNSNYQNSYNDNIKLNLFQQKNIIDPSIKNINNSNIIDQTDTIIQIENNNERDDYIT